MANPPIPAVIALCNAPALGKAGDRPWADIERGNVGRGAVLFYAPAPHGGIAVHVHYQARELARRGFAVEVLCRPDFFQPADSADYRQTRRLIAVRGSGIVAKAGRVLAEIANRYILAWSILRRRPQFVVWEANSEYFAPAWFAPLWLLRRLGGVVTLANFHDPLRERRRGPRWFHDLTVRLAYAPLDGGLIHGPVPPGAWLPARLTLREAPFGPFDELSGDDLIGTAPSFDLRARLGIPGDAFVLLAFGHIADRKNLDLAIAALAQVPEVQLVIAGSVASGRDKPAAFYVAEAARLHVSERVHLVTGFIAEADIAAYFAAADAVALTYERGFVSQSGVLQIAALWDRPLLASGGAGPLIATVRQFGLGLVVEPDSIPAIAEGLARLVAERPVLGDNFRRYRETTSWSVNIDRMLEAYEAARTARGLANSAP